MRQGKIRAPVPDLCVELPSVSKQAKITGSIIIREGEVTMNFKIHVAAVIALVGAFLMIAPAFANSYQDKVNKDKQVEIKVGQVPPDFTIKDLNGNEITLSDMAGKQPVVIDFWATWCGWCVKEMPLMEKFQEQYGDKVAVYCITSEATTRTTRLSNSFRTIITKWILSRIRRKRYRRHMVSMEFRILW